MKAVFVANLEAVKTEGIYKKICAEAEAIGHVMGECCMITRKNNQAAVYECNSKQTVIMQDAFLDYVFYKLKCEKIDLLYVRHMIPSYKLISILKHARQKRVKIYYEIPTYPYFAEQYRTSKKKYRAVAKIGLDIFFWPLIYKHIDKLVIIRSNSNAKMYKKMVEITNGVRTDNIKSKDYTQINSKKVFRMVTVGTLYPYHGYDRVLEGLAKCNEKINNVEIEFHVVGSSGTIDELRDLANQLGLKNVFFHGTKTTEELNEMYEFFDVGLGCMALHRRNADIDTTLKVIEYYCRGIPVITSGKSPLKANEYTYVVPDNEEAIDINSIYKYYNGLEREKLEKLSLLAKKQFSWKCIMEELLADMD